MNVFDEVISRNETNSLKWDKLKLVYQRENVEGIIPMWVADMDFAAPNSIQQAIQKRLDNTIYGYSFEGKACEDAVVNWLKSQHDTVIDPAWILYHQGVVPAIATIVETFTKENDHILTTAPIYPPFFSVPKTLNRHVTFCPLEEQDGVYQLNFETFEQLLQKEEVTLFILCHPHNPIGFTWTTEELRQIATLCKKHNVLLLSDEIHSDLVLRGKHMPMLKAVAENAYDNIITLFAPTKTFNIAGIHAAMLFVPDANKRLALQKTYQKQCISGLNIFAAAAVEGAFSEQSATWLENLKDYLRENIRETATTLSKIPGVRIRENDATYLMWLDYRQTGLDEKALMNALLDEGVALDPGTKYGEHGRGFLRINIACPNKTLKEALGRIQKAFEKLQQA